LTLSKKPSVLPPSGRRIQTRRSGVHGKGVFAVQPIAQGEKVIEYVGEVITWKEADRRHPHNPKDPNHTFYFHLDDKHVLDALYGGNSSRWINHACEPNCEADVEDKRVFIKALRDIEPGEELNYDYGLVIDSPLTPELKAEYACWCGAPSCRGTMLASSDDEKKSKKNKKKKDKKRQKSKDKRREQRRKSKSADQG
jgi:SET domain-containing protein